ncbi:MAG TPA: response regulator, partial [Bacteroidales bacterium]|nr:response regulator [Bacteroidales bacterium]
KKNNPQSKTRFILVSSTAMPLTYQEFKEYGVDAILSKPVKIHELYHIIEKLADKVPVRPTVSETIHIEKPVVLIVEDNIINEKVAKATLERLGYMVDVAENGKVAWQKYIEHRYELILMDVEMPEMDGIQTTIKIRDFENHSGNGKHPRIIAVTANVKPGDRELCLNAGMDDYISKPFKHEELIKVLTSNK